MCVCVRARVYAWSHEAEEHWGPKAASESFCRAVVARVLVKKSVVSGVVWCGVVCAGLPIERGPKNSGLLPTAHRGGHRATRHCQAPRVAMLAVRRSACFYTTVGLCETSTLFFFLLLAADAAAANTRDRPLRTRPACRHVVVPAWIDRLLIARSVFNPCLSLSPRFPGGLLDRRLWC